MGSTRRTTAPRRLRAQAGACVALALLAAVWSVYQIHLPSLRVTPRSLELATATTSILVDSPAPALVNQQLDTYGFKDLTDRAVLLGSVMANGPARAAIAAEAGVPVDRLQVDAPLTREQPRAPVEPGKEKKTSDILKSNDQYRLDIEVNPTVPVLDVYAQAPTALQAERLANAAFDASRDHVAALEAAEQTPGRVRLTLRQLGRARGAVVNEGVHWQIAAVAFTLTLALTAAILIVITRIRRGWRVAILTEQSTGA